MIGDALMIRAEGPRERAVRLGYRDRATTWGRRHGFPSVRVGVHAPARRWSATATGSGRG